MRLREPCVLPRSPLLTQSHCKGNIKNLARPGVSLVKALCDTNALARARKTSVTGFTQRPHLSAVQLLKSVPRAGILHTPGGVGCGEDRKSTRLNSSHSQISYAVFCLKKK